MSIVSKNDKLIRIFIFTILIATSVFANLEVQKIAHSEGLMVLSQKWYVFQYVSWLIPVFLFVMLLVGDRWKEKIYKYQQIRKIAAALLFLIGLSLIVFLYNGVGSYQRFFNGYFMKSLFVAVGISAVYYSLRLFTKQRQPIYLFLITVVGFGFVFVLMRLFVTIVSTPFSLAWSEGSFIYLASTYFSKRYYGVTTGIPYIMSTRHLLEGIPFLIGRFSIEFHRGWLVFLNLISVGLFAASVIKRFKINTKWQGIIFLWSILFVFQGVIYYNILLSATIIIWGFNKDYKWRSFFVVLIASFFGGMNRINWAFTPPLIAGIMYLLESKQIIPSSREKIKFLVYPALLFVFGSMIGLVGLFGYYIGVGGYSFQTFLARMQADSLLSRLLPSDTFPLGVILASLLVTSVLWYFIFDQWGKFNNKLNKNLVILINLVLFLGSLLVSAKIGGGADLHNMDAYLVSVFVTFAYFTFPNFTKNELVSLFTNRKNNFALLLLFLIPVFWQVNYIKPAEIRMYSQEVAALNELQAVLDHYQAIDKRPVLLITQRQLLTFGALDNVQLVPEYELVDIFEMVMAENVSYLEQFRNELSERRYSLIITDPQPKEIVYGRIFNEESNKWFMEVTQYLNKNYELVCEISLPASPIQIYAAKDINAEKQR